MTMWSSYGGCPPDIVARRLRALGQCYSGLHRRVRQAAAEALADIVAGLSRAAVEGLLGHTAVAQRPASVGGGSDDDHDPWADETYGTAWSAWRPPAEEPDCTAFAPADVCTLALAWAAARWWLRRQGTLLGAAALAWRQELPSPPASAGCRPADLYCRLPSNCSRCSAGWRPSAPC